MLNQSPEQSEGAAKHLCANQTGVLPEPFTAEAETLPLRFAQGQGDRCGEARELEERIAENVAALLE